MGERACTAGVYTARTRWLKFDWLWSDGETEGMVRVYVGVGLGCGHPLMPWCKMVHLPDSLGKRRGVGGGGEEAVETKFLNWLKHDG